MGLISERLKIEKYEDKLEKINEKEQDEDIYTFFEPELPSEPAATTARTKIANPINKFASKLSAAKSGPKASRSKSRQTLSTLEKKTGDHGNGTRSGTITHDKMLLHEGSPVLDLKGDNYFSCAVGRKRSNARYLLGSSADIVTLLKELAVVSSSS